VLLLATEAAADASLPPHLREDFDTIAKNVLLEARLIDDLLDLTRITRGKLVLDRRPLPVHGILLDAIANVRPEVGEKQLKLTVDLCGGVPMVDTDPVRLQQVFWNVLKNAAKFTPEHGEISVRTRMPAKAARLVIEITDTGAGMTAAELDRIFDAFTQGDHAGQGSQHRFGGLGLGLAISRTLLELHAGTIRASSPGPGRGSTFMIELPLTAAVGRPGSEFAAAPAHQRS
jgi:signal transduction histidine kinase